MEIFGFETSDVVNETETLLDKVTLFIRSYIWCHRPQYQAVNLAVSNLFFVIHVLNNKKCS